MRNSIRTSTRYAALLSWAAMTMVVLSLLDPSLAHAFGGNGGGGAFAGGVIQRAYCDIVWYTEGNLGALLLSVSGITGLAYAAFGNMERMKAFVVAGTSASTMSAGISLYFGNFNCPQLYTPRVTRTLEQARTEKEQFDSAINVALGLDSQKEDENPFAYQSRIREAEAAATEAAARPEEADSDDPFDYEADF